MIVIDHPEFIKNEYFEEYCELIRGRRENPPPENETTEKHHGLPRSMGGPDGDNIVVVTSAEHFRLHKLLTKCTKEKAKRSMIYAFSWMCSCKKYCATAEEYTLARKAQAQLASKRARGRGNPHYIDTEYVFMHRDGRVFTGTRFEFYSCFNLHHSRVNRVISGEHRQTHGWFCLGTERSRRGKQMPSPASLWSEHKRKTKIHREGKGTDPNTYTFSHEEYGIRECTQLELRREFDLSSSGLYKLLHGAQRSHRGWVLVKN